MDLPFLKERLEQEKLHLKELLEFSKGIEHSATFIARRTIKNYEAKIKEMEEQS